MTDIQKEEKELKPCPFCGGAIYIRSNRDWHRLVGDHSDGCIIGDEDEHAMVPATEEARLEIIAAWNLRSRPEGWISLADSKPEVGADVWLKTNEGSILKGRLTVDDDYWIDELDSWLGGAGNLFAHWMPIAAAPDGREG